MDKLFEVPETTDPKIKYAALKAGLRNEKLMMQLTKSFADQLLLLLAERFKDLSLSLALTRMTSIENAPKYLITFRDKHFERLVKEEMTPHKFMEVLRLQEPEFEPHSYTSLDQFLKEYNKEKGTEVSVLDVLRSSGYWDDSELLQKLEKDKKKNFDPVADLVYDQLWYFLDAIR
ncbi:hypothetical protein PsorP6_013196 [Peronosclerospora sorghi]|uniref:Uncharacterized protein n=1 Tax=Peronosclerospora sorghi TaxID=230839 RepID=A0ACC0WG55_9STRA|nr:hypothetical protein PsorP6_013196 [Peronosclerospora sorghi]